MEQHYFLVVCLTWALAFLPVIICAVLRRALYH